VRNVWPERAAQVSSKTEEGVKHLFERVAVVLFEKAVVRAREAMQRAEGTARGPQRSGKVSVSA